MTEWKPCPVCGADGYTLHATPMGWTCNCPSCRTCKRCLAIKEGGRVVCSKFLGLTEPSECRYYEPIKEVAQ